jgi:hypothetical protein
MIIDCHGHYTTAPASHDAFRKQQIAHYNDPSLPVPVYPDISDAELRQFVEAMTQIRAVTANVQNGQATPEQSAQLTAAVEGSGLAVDRFNAVATAVSQDVGLRARAELIGARQQEAGAQ